MVQAHMSTMSMRVFNNKNIRLIQRDNNTAAFSSSLGIDNGLSGANLVLDPTNMTDDARGASWTRRNTTAA